MCLHDEVCKKVSDEFYAYKADVLKCNNPETVWDLSNRISFYSCVAEYFDCMENIAEKILNVLDKFIHPIYAMWTEYLKSEQLQYTKFEDIEEILDVMVQNEEERNHECC